MIKVLVSACLLGELVRYDKKSKALDNELLKKWHEQGRLMSFCPEVEGGLPVPRPAAEIESHSPLKIITKDQKEVTDSFEQGALLALKICQKHNIKVAILTEKSPSCGSSLIYDGSFTRSVIGGEGVTTQLLRKHGVTVFNQYQIHQVKDFLSNE